MLDNKYNNNINNKSNFKDRSTSLLTVKKNKIWIRLIKNIIIHITIQISRGFV